VDEPVRVLGDLLADALAIDVCHLHNIPARIIRRAS